MKFTLFFELEKPEVPLEYRRSILSFIKAALTKCNNGKYFDVYYKDTIQKNFNWYAIFPNPMFTKEKIILEKNNFKVIFSLEDSNHSGYILLMAMNGMKHKKLSLENDNFMVLKDIQQNEQKIILGNQCLFKTSTGSPCVVREHSKETNLDYYYCVLDQNFDSKLTEALKRQALSNGFEGQEVESITARMIRGKKVVVKHYGQLINTSNGLIEIQAPSIILQHFYQVGICSRRSSGFGAIEVIAEKQ